MGTITKQFDDKTLKQGREIYPEPGSESLDVNPRWKTSHHSCRNPNPTTKPGDGKR